MAIRARTGYLPGGIAFHDGLTGERHLDDLADLAGRPSVRRAALCDRLELSDRTLRRPIRDYSRGMRQKLGIVQALQHDPELAILDEPSEGLDPLMQRAFYSILDDVRGAGRTVLFSSHVLSEVERVCDRVAVVRSGRLVANDDVATLLARRKRRVEVQFEGDAPGPRRRAGRVGGRDRRHAPDVRPRRRPASRCSRRSPRSPVSDLLIEPARLEDAFLELYAADEEPESDVDRAPSAGRRMINAPLLRQTWRAQRTRVAVIAIALAVWSSLMPVIYATFGRQMESLIQSGIIPEAFLRLLGSSVFGLDAAIALGVGHPIAIALQVVYPVGFAAAAIAGERQSGTLEVLLARPVSRRTVFVTLLVAILGIAVVTSAAAVLGTVIGSAAYGLAGELDAGHEGLAVPEHRAAARGAGRDLAGRVGLVRPAGAGDLDRRRRRAARLPARDPGPAVAGRRGRAAVLAVPLPPAVRDPGRTGRADATCSSCWRVFGVAVAFGLWHFPRRDLAAPS